MEIEFASSATTEKSGMIQAINKDTVHQICSGQVVLNLATAVKELVENSLDAGATSIDVRLKEFGSELIEVTDNGCGVEEHNFQGLTLKHHTSKLREFSDLTTVETFGFRGEALSSLCALSNLTIITCHKGAPCGTKLEFDHKGLITSCRSHARQVGTTVILQNLFSCLPVRQKEFHRNLRREFSKMANLLYAYCLVSTGVKITCVNQNNKGGRTMVVTTQGSSSVRENIAAVFGTKQLQTILDLPTEPPEDEVLKELGAPPQMVEDKDLFQLEGCVSSCAHGAGRATSDRQFYYINSRPCEPTKVIKLVNEVYHQFNKHQFPFAFINLKTSRHNVDVNVTPDKRQVFLDKEKLILATVKACLLRIYEGVTSTLPLDNCANRTSPPTPGGLHTMMKQWGRDPATPLGRGLKRALQQTPGRNRGTPKQLCMSDFIKRSAVSPSDSLDNLESSKSLADISTTDVEENHTLQQESSADHLINGLLQETSADHLINGLQQETSADFIINSLQQETSADHLINGLLQETSADHLINGLQQETSAVHLINSLPQETSADHLINDLQQETSANHLLNKLQVPYSNGVKHKSYNSATKIGIRQISETTMSESRLPQTAGKEHSSVAKATRSFQLVPTTIASNGDPAFIEEATSNSVNDESSGVKSCGVWLTQEVESIEKLQTDETRGTHTVRPVSQVSVTLDGVRRLLESRENRRNRWTAAPVVNKFHADINPSKNTIAEQELKKEISKDMFAKMSIVGQFNLGFIVVRLRADLFIIDQHASDEKYNFEKLQRDTALRNQRLVIPQKLELTAVNEGILVENVEIFRNNGFDFLIDKEAESSRRVQLTAIPMSKNWHFGKEDIDELLFMLQDSPHTMCRPSRVRAMFASRACRKSVMIGMALNLSDMRRLVDHMGEMDQPWVGFIYNWDLPFLTNHEALGQPQPHSRLAHTAFNYEALGQPQPHSRVAHTAFNHEALGQVQPHSRLAHTAFNYVTLGQARPHSRLAHTVFNYVTLGQPRTHSRLAHTAFNYVTLGQARPHSRLAHTAFNYVTLGQARPLSRLAHTVFNYVTLGQPRPHSRLAHTAFNYVTLGQAQPLSRLAHTAFNYETLGQAQLLSRLAHTAFNYVTLGQAQPHSRLAHTAFNYETLGQAQLLSRLAHTAFNYVTLGQAQPHSRLAHTAFNYETLGQAQLLSRLAHTAFNYVTLGQAQPHSRLAHTAFNYETLGQAQLLSRLAHTAFNYVTLGQAQPHSRLAHTAFNYETLGQAQLLSRLAHTAFNYVTLGQAQPHSRLAHTAFNYETLGQPQPHSRLAHTAFNYVTLGQAQPLPRLETSKKLSVFTSQLY
uniref:Mismatch repair endonuclease PMS2 n=2 Tax=Timema TaxID=61471 RepID=A0A7R9B692_TIMSH|nr:unnamed protein product [Timema shepardi]